MEEVCASGGLGWPWAAVRRWAWSAQRLSVQMMSCPLARRWPARTSAQWFRQSLCLRLGGVARGSGGGVVATTAGGEDGHLEQEGEEENRNFPPGTCRANWAEDAGVDWSPRLRWTYPRISRGPGGKGNWGRRSEAGGAGHQGGAPHRRGWSLSAKSISRKSPEPQPVDGVPAAAVQVQQVCFLCALWFERSPSIISLRWA